MAFPACLHYASPEKYADVLKNIPALQITLVNSIDGESTYEILTTGRNWEAR